MSERRAVTWVDWVAIGCFAIGAYGTILMLMALKSSTPLEEQYISGLIAAKWKVGLGIFPSLFWNAAVALIGAQLFLQGGRRNFVRNLIGVTGLTLALSVAFGALKSDAGGFVGQRTGAVVTSLTHIAVGVFTGMVAMFAVAWFAWLRNSGASSPVSSASTSGSLTPATSTPAAKPAAKGAAARSTARAQPFKSTTSAEGVTAAESAALFPDEEIIAEEIPRVVPVARKTAPAIVPPQAAPSSPYPEDVRRKGQVPPGAKPLESLNAPDERPGDLPAPTVYRWTAPRVEERIQDGPGAHLAGAVGDAAVGDEPHVQDDVEEDEFDEVEHDEGFELTVEGSIEEIATDTVTNAYAAPIATVPTPSWEQPALFEPQEGDEEPVDAYGTPMTLVEKLRQARRESGIEERASAAAPEATNAPIANAPKMSAASSVGSAAPIGFEVDEDELSDEEVDHEPIAASIAIVEEEEEEEAEESDEDDFYDEEETALVEEEAAASSTDEEGEEDEYDEEFDDDEHAAGLEEAEVIDEEEESEVEVIAAELEPVLAEAPVAPTKPAPSSLVPRELDAEPEAPVKKTAARAPVSIEPVKAPIAAEPSEMRPAAQRETSPRADSPKAESPKAESPKAEPAQPSLFDAVEKPPKKAAAARIEPAERAESAEQADPAEKHVVLQPQAAVPPERATKSMGGVDPRTKLLTEIGCLFIEKGRVAVSMLQRQYTMEFDEACKVLDDLQEMGLIGPYLGGQRRDILLTREQWLETVSKAAAPR
jgi:hypothetical protein